MPATPSLTAYRFGVTLGDPAEPDTLETLEVTAFGRDIQKVEALFAERKWGTAQDRPMTATVAAVYYALTRSGKYSGSFDDFESTYVEVTDGGAQRINPTERDPMPASP